MVFLGRDKRAALSEDRNPIKNDGTFERCWTAQERLLQAQAASEEFVVLSIKFLRAVTTSGKDHQGSLMP